jgi:predicted RNA binding protein YcfA (HicA-like mRNA interferase family)
VKKRDLIRRLQDLGYWQVKGTKHEKWTNGHHVTMVPRHNEIPEGTAQGILKQCEGAAKAKAKADRERAGSKRKD